MANIARVMFDGHVGYVEAESLRPLPDAEPLGCRLPPEYPGLSNEDFEHLRKYKAEHADMVAVRDGVTAADLVRLAFVRWLVDTGRLVA